MRNKCVTVIVPVFNAEKFLRKCINSILNQTCSDIEVILVNDGSTDGCPQICDEYALLDDRVVVFHKPNGGTSAARNDGIKAASGEYILFVDADDYIEPEAVKNLYQRAKTDNLDILVGTFYFNEVARIRYADEGVYKRTWKSDDFFLYKLQQGYRGVVIWTSLYRKLFIIDNNLFFMEGIVHEDELWTPSLYLASGRLGLIKFPFYHYNISNTESITRRTDQSRNGKDYLVICKNLEKLYNGIENKALKEAALDSLAHLYIYAVIRCKLFKRKHSKAEDIKFLKKKAFLKKTKLKVILFFISRKFSYYIFKLKRKLIYERKIANSQKN